MPPWNNITRVILIKFFTTLYFYLPYMTLYFRERGFSYVQINSIWGIVVFTMFLTEIPTGILADRWGRRRAIQAAIFCQFLGELLFLFITDYWLLVVDAVIAGIGFAFGSGAFEALVYDTLKSENRLDEVQQVMGKITGASYLGFIISFGISGLLVSEATRESIQTAVIATVIAVGLGFLVTLALKPAQTPTEESKPSSIHLIKEGFQLLRHHRKLQNLVLLSILTIAFWDYLSSLYQPYFQDIGVPNGLFGPTLALASLCAFIAARLTHQLEKRLGARLSLLIATLGPGLIYLIFFINHRPLIGILGVALFRGFNALKHPLFSDFNNRYIKSHHRATVLSMISMISGVYTTLMGVVIGAIAERWLQGAFLFCGLLVTAASLLLRPKMDSPSPN